MRNSCQLYFTDQAIQALKQIEQHQEYQLIKNYLLHNLCYYPLQGRLLLNYETRDPEIKKMINDISTKVKQDIRGFCYENYLILYLNYQLHLYVLDIISLHYTDPTIIQYWR